MTSLDKTKYTIVAGLAIVAIIAVAFIFHAIKNTSVTLGVDEKIHNTPVSVERLREIGQWEFLSVSDEELVDTVRKHVFSKDELIRIYYGQLSIGMNMKDMSNDAIKMIGDSVIIQLPEVVLLDEDFIDEARTQSFYESGKWSGKDYEALYQKAQRQMKERCMTEENITLARENAIAEMTKMMHALGVQRVNIR